MKKKWIQPLKLHWTYFRQKQKTFFSNNESWERLAVYSTKKGVVIIQEIHYILKDRTINTTDFETVVNGTLYRMVVDQVDMLEASLKNIATRFLNDCIKNESTPGWIEPTK